MSDPVRPWRPDPRLGNIPAATLQNRQDRPVMVTFPALQFAAIQLSAITSPFGRPLYETELGIITDIYGTSVDARRVRIVEARILNAPTTLGNQIRVPPGWSFLDGNRPVLVHEFGHIWQYQTQGTGYISDSVYHNASGQISTGNRNVAYMNYRLHEGANISEYTAEEQATIIGDYYEMTRIYQNTTPPPAWVAQRSPDMPIYERLMTQVRSATPAPDTVIYQRSLMFQAPPNMPEIPLPGGQQFTPTMPIVQVRF